MKSAMPLDPNETRFCLRAGQLLAHRPSASPQLPAVEGVLGSIGREMGGVGFGAAEMMHSTGLFVASTLMVVRAEDGLI
ncbi:MAG TPA: hypothetical protein PLY09_04100 [Methanothrix sp.]|nr:hypothetical protein [Methanothrix sp.]HPJ83925.1 hypothetical protein [Methanothrix sp.]